MQARPTAHPSHPPPRPSHLPQDLYGESKQLPTQMAPPQYHTRQPSLSDDCDRDRDHDRRNILSQKPSPTPGSAPAPAPSSAHSQHTPRDAAPSFPDTPTTELPPIQSPYERNTSPSNHTLPSLSSVTSGLQQPSPEPRAAVTHWPSLNPYTVYYTPSHAQSADPPQRPDVEMNSASPERYYDRRSASVSLDDPDVRMAAEALGDLRADFVSSPPHRSTPLPSTPRDHRMATSSPRDSASEHSKPEPLLSLITASHPLLATTIEGATLAYNHGKNFSPHLKMGAEYIEDYLTPVAKVVGTVGRQTGLETGVRYIFRRSSQQSRKHQVANDIEADDRGNYKRRKARLSDKEKEAFDRGFPEAVSQSKERRTSVSTVDTLPAYDDFKSPAYSEVIETQAPTRPGSSTSIGAHIAVTTSSLTIAIRDESLRNLKFCLEMLRQGNTSLSAMVSTLQGVIEQLDTAMGKRDRDDDAMTDVPPQVGELTARMDRIKNEIVMKIGSVMKMVSSYAGSALPDNARDIVYRQLWSLPRRFHFHQSQNASIQPGTATDQETITRETANKVLLLANECLEVMSSVSDVLDRTIKSAEEWCAAKGNRKSGDAESPNDSKTVPPTAQWATRESLPTSANADEDIHMVS